MHWQTIIALGEQLADHCGSQRQVNWNGDVVDLGDGWSHRIRVMPVEKKDAALL